jgi:tetratricopeptide (TPR) repeat protein
MVSAHERAILPQVSQVEASWWAAWKKTIQLWLGSFQLNFRVPDWAGVSLLLILGLSGLWFSLRSKPPVPLALSPVASQADHNFVQLTSPDAGRGSSHDASRPWEPASGSILIHKDLDLTPIEVPAEVTPGAMLQRTTYLLGTARTSENFWHISGRPAVSEIEAFIGQLKASLIKVQGGLGAKMDVAQANIAALVDKRGWRLEDFRYAPPQGAGQHSFEYFMAAGAESHKQGQYQAAIQAYNDALDTFEPAAAPAKLFAAYFNIGLAHKAAGGSIHQAAAYQYFLLAKAALEAARPNEEKDQADWQLRLAKCERDMGAVLISLGHYELALSHLAGAAANDENLKKYRFLARDRIFMANADWYLGQYEPALAHYRAVYDLAADLAQSDGEKVAREYQLEALIGLGNSAAQMGFYSYADDFYQHGLALLRGDENPQTVAGLYLNIGYFQLDLFRYGSASGANGAGAPDSLARAQSYLEQSLAIRTKLADDSLTGNVQNSLAEVLLARHQYEAARAMLASAREKFQKRAGEAGLAETNLLLAQLLSQAEAAGDRTILPKMQAMLASSLPLAGSPRMNSNAPAGCADPAKASHEVVFFLLDSAHDQALTLNLSDLLWKINLNKGLYYEQCGDNQQALTAWQAALDISENIRSQFRNLDFARSFIIPRIELYQRLSSLLQKMGEPAGSQAYENLERAWWQRLSDARQREKMNAALERSMIQNI